MDNVARDHAPNADAATRASGLALPPKWTCFHCREAFDNDQCAADHFGLDDTELPACVQMLTETEKAIVESRREWRDRAMRAEAENDTLGYQVNRGEWDIRSRFKGCRTVADAWFSYESVEGRALAAEAALNAAPRWLARLLRWKAERLFSDGVGHGTTSNADASLLPGIPPETPPGDHKP